MRLEGRARVLAGAAGENVNTDYIIASHRKRESLDPQILRRYLFEELAPGLAAGLEAGDVIVAGKNFGCGSAMEVAVTALQGAGVRAVLAPSFSRTYYRNAINNGLLPGVCDTGAIREGDRLAIELTGAGPGEADGVRNLTTGARVDLSPLPAIMIAILEAGGLVPYLKHHGDFSV